MGGGRENDKNYENGENDDNDGDQHENYTSPLLSDVLAFASLKAASKMVMLLMQVLIWW